MGIRLIPAGAGKTEPEENPYDYAPAHPRRCGENGFYYLFATLRVGSSPQVRGKQDGALAVGIRKRLIPAGAGKTHIHLADQKADQAHPRRCGENTGVFYDAS